MRGGLARPLRSDGSMSNQTIRSNAPRPPVQMKPVVCRAHAGHVTCSASDEAARITAEWKPAPSADALLGGAALQRRGQRGASIRQLQADLERHCPGEVPLAIDGVFGPKTEARVRAFQARHGLAVDGVVGDETRAQLDAMTMRDLLLDERFERLPKSTQETILQREADATPESRRHLIEVITSEPFSALPVEAQANLLEWNPIEARIVMGV